MTETTNQNRMKKRQETISGNRYLIYYTFDEPLAERETIEQPAATAVAPEAEMTEERNV